MNEKLNVMTRRCRVAMAVTMSSMMCYAATCDAASASTPAEAPWIVPVRDNVYVIMGGGANVTVHIGASGVLVVDTGAQEHADEIIGLIRRLTSAPIRYLITTHDDALHRGANAEVAMAGTKFSGTGNAGFREDPSTAEVIAHENVLTSMSALDPAPAFEGWPTSTFFTESKSLSFNQEGVDILHVPNSHSDGDTIVFFRRSDVIAAGDLYTPDRYPYFDVSKGGSLQGVIDGLTRIIDMTITGNMQEGGTLVVPGHGRIGNEADVVEYRDMLTIIRNYIQEMIREKRSLAAIQKARPTFGFDPLYARGTTEWTVEQFVAAIYRELTQEGRKP